MKIGERIRCLRRQKGLTQAALAAKVGLKCSSLSDVELGKNTASSHLIIQLSKTFNVSTDYLLTGHELANDVGATIRNLEEEEVLEMYRNDKQIKELLADVLKSKKKMINRLNEQIMKSERNCQNA
jgi:transcriptional regulator with XRE-family HTH domain